MSLGLVAYGSSGEDSDADSGDETIPVTPLSIKKGLALPAPKKVTTAADEDENPVAKQPKSMFSALPAPKKDVLAGLVEETDDPIPSGKNGTGPKQKVKISVPSLTQFKNDVEEPKPKKQKLTPKGSGLLAFLPEPVNTTTGKKAMIPHILTRKPLPKPAKKPVPMKKAPLQKPALVTNYSESEDESGDESSGFTPSTSRSGIDFFSLTNQVQTVAAEINLDDLLPQAGPSKPEQIPETTYAEVEEVEETEVVSDEPQEEKELSDEAIRKLCGRRQEDLTNMIDIQGEAVYADSKEWMLRNLTEEPEKDYSHRDKTPNSTQKRKHQITYLAFQAKERETELKNQWAANRQSKKQTQAKYGF
ncbi:proline-rich protein PRCC [Neocloeon triangulifer]|uniref:proline-rich protein PRCC n=1 Tax=Neocloeon triangulifer TaxID=2078957 RepID=UPI00286F8C37|nr:proline-rich protein PRCC [Neocloeon triangulifer]